MNKQQGTVKDNKTVLHTVVLSSPVGEFEFCFSNTGLCRVNFPDAHTTKASPKTADNQFTAPLTKWFNAYWNKQPIPFPDTIPFDFSGNTAFEQKVLNIIASIPFGKTQTYSQIAEQCGGKNYCRAAANACGSNPIPVVIACHRIIRSDKTLGGFSAGQKWKQMLLSHENVL